MDLLQTLFYEHSEIRQQLQHLSALDTERKDLIRYSILHLQKMLQHHRAVEERFFSQLEKHGKIKNQSVEVDDHVHEFLESHLSQLISSGFEQLDKNQIRIKISDFYDLIDDHFAAEEMELFPLIRKEVPSTDIYNWGIQALAHQPTLTWLAP